jgi:hypothetical protein
MGPAADGTCAEVQLYRDEASSRAFPDRVKREDEPLRALWDRYQTVCDTDGWRTIRFEGMEFMAESFVRAAAGLTE